MKRTFYCFAFSLLTFCCFAQHSISIEGYVYESGNRGYLSNIEVILYQSDNDSLVAFTKSNQDGFFVLPAVANRTYKIVTEHQMFERLETSVNTEVDSKTAKVFAQLELERAPGYIFEVTLAEERKNDEIPVDGIKNARIEVYNNTTKKPVLELLDYTDPDFNVHFVKGNHYTILIRKKGFLTKRMEAYVDVEGCILCFEGVGDVRPGVADNLTSENKTGVLLANVELQQSLEGRKIELNNIYYELGSAKLNDEAKKELEKLVMFLNDNPNLKIEIGAHTDARGSDELNKKLAQSRAKSVTDFLIEIGGISPLRLVAFGYGDTQLKNKCDDGVICTEEEHALNRRTEMKLLGNMNTDVIIRSLASMKQDEHMDELLKEIQEEGTVRIPGGIKDPADLDKVKKKLSKEERAKSKEDRKNAIKEKRSKNGEKRARYRMIEKDTSTDAPVLEQSINEKTTVPTFGVVILRSENKLKAEHPFYQKFTDFQEMEDPAGGFMYLIGDFASKEAAQAHINARLFRSFPEAFVMQYPN